MQIFTLCVFVWFSNFTIYREYFALTQEITFLFKRQKENNKNRQIWKAFFCSSCVNNHENRTMSIKSTKNENLFCITLTKYPGRNLFERSQWRQQQMITTPLHKLLIFISCFVCSFFSSPFLFFSRFLLSLFVHLLNELILINVISHSHPIFLHFLVFFFSQAVTKEGYLMKQKWKFHQRWRRRYFRLKGHKLYYSKDADEVCIQNSLLASFGQT